MNRATLIGNAGNVPEVTYTQSGKAVANFNLATNKKYKKQDGEQVEETEWHNIVVFGKLAEIVGKHFEKGKKYFIEGEIKTETWEKDGIKRYTTKIYMNNFEFLN